MKLLKIGAILDHNNNNNKTDEESLKRIGSLIKNFSNVEIGGKLSLQYVERRGKPYEGFLITSPVLELDEDCGGVWVKTWNSKYRFDNVYREV